MILAAACGSLPADATSTQNVIGGEPESGFPAVGYLVSLLQPGNARCTVTLVAPRVLVTAAHCVRDRRAQELGVGFGPFSRTATSHRVLRVASHALFTEPGIDVDTPERPLHDLAVMLLEDAPEISPVPLAPVRIGETLRQIGYGVTDETQTADNMLSERRSIPIEVTGSDEERIFARTSSGDVCHGDSGGPGMNGEGLVGVLSHGDPALAGCPAGERLTLTSTTTPTERALIDCATAWQQRSPSSSRYEDLFCSWIESFADALGDRNFVDGPRFNDDYIRSWDSVLAAVAVALGLAPAEVPGADWYQLGRDRAQIARAAGFAPTPDDELGPTRERVIALLARGLALPPSADLGSLRGLSDVADTSPNLRPLLAAAASARLIVGSPDAHELSPGTFVRQGELLAMLYQVLVLRGERAPLSSAAIYLPGP